MNKALNKPFNWYGGKAALAPLLASLLPPHKVYVEVFGGSGALLFAKEPSRLEVINDLDSGVVNFFRVLRDEAQSKQLQHLLDLSPYAREEYYDSLKGWEAAPDPVEKARQWYVAVMQSMNSSIRASGWSCTKYSDANPARTWRKRMDGLDACTNRLRYVEIDHRDFEQVIRLYGSVETCFYLDPPYVPEIRSKARCYHHEMTQADHERLLSCVVAVKGMVILSGYAHPLYDETLASWERLQLTVSCSSAHYSATERKRTECIWLSPACRERQISLFTSPTDEEVFTQPLSQDSTHAQ